MKNENTIKENAKRITHAHLYTIQHTNKSTGWPQKSKPQSFVHIFAKY